MVGKPKAVRVEQAKTNKIKLKFSFPAPKMSEEDAKISSKIRSKVKITKSGDWCSPTKEIYKKLGKDFPEPTISKDEAITKWKPMLSGISPEFHARAAYVFESEALALNALSESDKCSENVGRQLKFLFSAINKELRNLT